MCKSYVQHGAEIKQKAPASLLRSFLTCALGICLLMLLDNAWELRDAFLYEGYTVYYFFFNAVVFSGMFTTYIGAVVCTLPFNTYAASRSLHLSGGQGDIKAARKHAFPSFMKSIAGSGLCMAAGWGLFILLLRVRFPFVGLQTVDSGMVAFPYVQGSMQGRVLFHLFAILFNAFLTGCLWAALANAFSVWAKRYELIIVPFVARFTLVQIYRLFAVSENFRLDAWLNMLTIYQSAAWTMLLSFLSTALVVGICFFIFYSGIARSLKHNERSEIF